MTRQISRTVSPWGMDGPSPPDTHLCAGHINKRCSTCAFGEHPWDMGSPTRGQNVSVVRNESLTCRQDASRASRPTCVNLLPCIKRTSDVACVARTFTAHKSPARGGRCLCGTSLLFALVSEVCASYESAVTMLRESDSEKRAGWNFI